MDTLETNKNAVAVTAQHADGACEATIKPETNRIPARVRVVGGNGNSWYRLGAEYSVKESGGAVWWVDHGPGTWSIQKEHAEPIYDEAESVFAPGKRVIVDWPQITSYHGKEGTIGALRQNDAWSVNLDGYFRAVWINECNMRPILDASQRARQSAAEYDAKAEVRAEPLKHSQYKRIIRLPLVEPTKEQTHATVLIDVYDILHAFKTGNPAVDHAVKKLLRAGTDHNDRITDLTEAQDSIARAIELEGGK